MLFEAHLKDGTIISQTPEDKSAYTPDKNAFYDVLQRLDEVQSFGLFREEDESQTFAVDLRDGHFEINRVAFLPHDSNIVFPIDTKYRLIYFKRTKLHFNTDLEQIDEEIAYHFGWQATVDGVNHQRTIEVF